MSFKNTVIIMTSNIGAKLITDSKKLGFSNLSEEDVIQRYESTKKDIMQELKKEFRPEFLNRIDEVIVFSKLQDNDLEKIVDLMTVKLLNRLEEQGILVEIDKSIKEFIIKQDIDKNYGARPLRRSIQNIIEDNITDAILDGRLKVNNKKVMLEENGKVLFK